jgi:DNA-binding transcriptional regulator YiaG
MGDFSPGMAADCGTAQHGNDTTTEAVRRARQNCEANLSALAEPHRVSQKTMATWTSVANLPTGPSFAKATVPMHNAEAMVVAFRRHTLLQLNDYMTRPPHC